MGIYVNGETVYCHMYTLVFSLIWTSIEVEILHSVMRYQHEWYMTFILREFKFIGHEWKGLKHRKMMLLREFFLFYSVLFFRTSSTHKILCKFPRIMQILRLIFQHSWYVMFVQRFTVSFHTQCSIWSHSRPGMQVKQQSSTFERQARQLK